MNLRLLHTVPSISDHKTLESFHNQTTANCDMNVENAFTLSSKRKYRKQ